jgi:hypothetical protein
MKKSTYIILAAAAFTFWSCEPVQEDLAPELKKEPSGTSNVPNPTGPFIVPCEFPNNDSLYINYSINTNILPPPRKHFDLGSMFPFFDGYRATAYSTSDKIFLTFYDAIGRASQPIEGTYTTKEFGSWCVKITGNFGGDQFDFTALDNQKVYVKYSTTPGIVEVYFCGINTTWQVFSLTGSMNIQGKLAFTR